jgi:glycosyltransferase involved in cell wall biosynthesis
VTPVHDLGEMVSRLLASLSEAIETFVQAGGSADVVLVDSSVGPEAWRIEALAEAHGEHVLRTANDVRHKRNQGIRNARGDIVLFVDSDCDADPSCSSSTPGVTVWASRRTGVPSVACSAL